MKILKNISLGVISVCVVSGIVYGFSGWEGVENAVDGDSLTHTVWNSLVDGVVKKTGSVAETITGVKTFSSSPIVPSPTASGEVASKGYVDGLPSLHSTNGYTYLPNGTIIQRGKYNGGSHAPTISFPITFPNAALNIQAIPEMVGDNRSTSMNTLGTSSVVISQWHGETASAVGFYWQAIGY